VENIHVTGIPIMPSFGSPHSRVECAREFGIDPTKPTFLLMLGGAGMGTMSRLARRLLTIGEDFQLIALAGKNPRLLSELQRLAKEHRNKLFPMGYTHSIDRVMAASDLAITKSGGLTTSECLAMGLPMIIVSPIPGQEERNADFLLEHGAALKAYDEAGLEFRVKALLKDRDKLNAMRENARRLGRGNAAEDILHVVVKAL
jgi:processive 1,2-diacylglycerol beta-glucosyltransferase